MKRLLNGLGKIFLQFCLLAMAGYGEYSSIIWRMLLKTTQRLQIYTSTSIRHKMATWKRVAIFILLWLCQGKPLIF